MVLGVVREARRGDGEEGCRWRVLDGDYDTVRWSHSDEQEYN
jgi:hypothetical protein